MYVYYFKPLFRNLSIDTDFGKSIGCIYFDDDVWDLVEYKFMDGDPTIASNCIDKCNSDGHNFAFVSNEYNKNMNYIQIFIDLIFKNLFNM